MKRNPAYPLLRIEQIPSEIGVCLVLGALLRADGKLTQMLIERMNAVEALHRLRPDMLFVLSGVGPDRPSSDMQAMYEFLVNERGFPAENLVCDGAGYTSFDSIRNMRNAVGDEPFALLTGYFHIPRCAYIARGLSANFVAVDMREFGTRPHKKRFLYREKLAMPKASARILAWKMRQNRAGN